VLALVAAFLFALAAALQQKGALNLPTLSLPQPISLGRASDERGGARPHGRRDRRPG
jgi:hypothetical protein